MKYGALEYAYAAPIAAALATDRGFAEWMLSRTKFSASRSGARVLAEEMKAQRSKAAKDWWRSHFTEKCRCEGCRGHETDLLAIFELETGRRVAVHIEVKQPTDKFHLGQGRAYSLRASCWVRQPPRAIIPHEDAATVLLCSESKLESYADEAREFGSIITFEEIARAFPGVLPVELV
jgi:hypothetical protein